METSFTNETRGHTVSNDTQDSQLNEHYVVVVAVVVFNLHKCGT